MNTTIIVKVRELNKARSNLPVISELYLELPQNDKGLMSVSLPAFF